MQLREILNHPTMKNLSVAAGKDGLDREVLQVGMIDAPDITDFLFDGQLLVTSGFHFAQNPQLLHDLIIGMKKTNASGIAIKSNRYIKNIPSDIIALSDNLAIPILWTPANDFLSLTVKKLTAIILETQNTELKQIIAINQKLSELNAQNITYQHLLDQSAKVLGTPLALLDSHFTAIYASNEWVSQREFLTHFLRFEAGVDYLNLTKPIRLTFNHQQVDVLPIFSALKENKAFAAFVVNEEDPTNFQILKRQQVMNTLGFANSRTDLLNETEFRNRSGFFLNVIQGGLSDAAIDSYLHDAKIDNMALFRMAIIDFLNKENTPETRQFEIRQQLTRWFIDERKWPVITFSHRQQLVLLIHDSIDSEKFIAELFNFLTDQPSLRYDFSIGFSRISQSIHSLSELYNQANNALELTSNLHPIVMYRPKNSQELLHLLPAQESEIFIRKTIGPILTIPELLETLQTYVFLHQNITAVANALFVHRNTITYRLKKIEELLDIDLEMPTILVDIQLALLLIQN